MLPESADYRRGYHDAQLEHADWLETFWVDLKAQLDALDTRRSAEFAALDRRLAELQGTIGKARNGNGASPH